LEKTWLHGDRVRGRVYEVAFADVELFVLPLWREASKDELEALAEAFGLELRANPSCHLDIEGVEGKN